MSLRKPRPQISQEEEQMIKMVDPEYTDPEDDEIEVDRKLRQKLQDEEDDPFDGIRRGVYGGYVRAPRGGYLSAPAGGFVAPILATLAPFAFDLLAGLFGGSTPSGSGIHKRYSTKSGGAFYRDMHRDLSHIDPVFANKVLGHLVGKNYKFNGAKTDGRLKYGNMLMPMLKHHLPKMMKGANKTALLHELEGHPLMEQEFPAGSGIWDSLWGGIKKIFTSDTAKKLGSKIVDKALPSIAEKGIDLATKKLEDYIDDKAKGPKLSREDVKRMREQIRNFEDETYVRGNLERMKQKKRPTRMELEENDDRDDYELPSGQSDVSRRRKLVEERKAQRSNDVVPYEPQKKVVETTPAPFVPRRLQFNGAGLKKKSGGAWKISLKRV